jgi:uncharacterized protein
MRKLLLASVLALALPAALFAYVSPGRPQGFVNDFAHMLSAGAVSDLENELTAFQSSKGAEIAVVTVPTIGTDETIETYATKLFEEWKIGGAKQDSGLLLLIARDDRKVRIEVGYGLEPSVTDIESSHIISDMLAPAFQNGNYDEGVKSAVERIMNDITTGAPEITNEETQKSMSIFDAIARIGLYPIIFFFMMLGSILGRTKSWWLGGVIGGVAGVLVGSFISFTTGLLYAAVLVPLGLLFDYIVSKHGGNDRGPRPPFFLGGGGFGGGRSSGGGFGGFGGGRSGGGGASGNW